TGSTTLSHVSLLVDGNNMSNQLTYNQTSQHYVADLTLNPGFHTIAASADAYCSYCTGQTWKVNATQKFCMGAGIAALNKTAFSQVDGKGWSATSDIATAIAPDGGPETKWQMTQTVPGTVVLPGKLTSAKFLCSCLRAPADANGTQVELAPCDPA